MKVLFLSPEKYLELSRYPFVEEHPQIKNFSEINDSGASRLTINHGLLIGERGK